MNVLRQSIRALPFFVVASVAACQSHNQNSQSAALVNPSSETITELQRTMSTSLYGAPVTLSESAFTDGNVLTVETRARNSPDARLAGGRTMVRPEQFRLIAQGDDCLLEKLSTGERFQLRVARCQPVITPPGG